MWNESATRARLPTTVPTPSSRNKNAVSTASTQASSERRDPESRTEPGSFAGGLLASNSLSLNARRWPDMVTEAGVHQICSQSA